MKNKNFDLETALKELENITSKLALQEVSVKDAFDLYEKGVSLYLECVNDMNVYDHKLSVLKNKMDLATEKSLTPLLEEYDQATES